MNLTPAELEQLALRWRADTGVIPVAIWRALSPDAQRRLQSVSQTAAERIVRSRTKTPEMDREQLRQLAIACGVIS